MDGTGSACEGLRVGAGETSVVEAAAGRAPEAVRLYREAVDRDPGNLTAYRGLLEAAARAGDAEQVRRAREVLGGR